MCNQPFPLMIFAAGFGKRMGQLTATRPKPLVQVAGKPLIDHALDLAKDAGNRVTVVNVHYLAGQLINHLEDRAVAISHERGQILETGGGLRAALPLLGPGPVMALNSDAVWTGPNPLRQLANAWDGSRMDALLLLLPTGRATGHGTTADFLLSDDGRIMRGTGREDHVFVGASMINPECLAEIPDQVFSLNRPWDRIIACGRAFGVVHQGGWCDVGTAEGIELAEALLQGRAHG